MGGRSGPGPSPARARPAAPPWGRARSVRRRLGSVASRSSSCRPRAPRRTRAPRPASHGTPRAPPPRRAVSSLPHPCRRPGLAYRRRTRGRVTVQEWGRNALSAGGTGHARRTRSAEEEPPRERADERGRSVHPHRTLFHRLHEQILLEPRVLGTERDLPGPQDQPVVATRSAQQLEPDHRTACGELAEDHMPPDPLHQPIRIDLRRPLVRHEPANPPGAHSIEHSNQVAAGIGELVLGPRSVVHDATLDDRLPLEMPETLGEGRPRDAGQAPLELVEAPHASQKLTDHEQPPPVAEEVERAGQWAVLVPGRHARIVPQVRDPYQFAIRTGPTTGWLGSVGFVDRERGARP